MRERRWRSALSLAVLALVLSPLVTDRDSFPLSTHPMYAHDRGDVAVFRTVEAVADGQPATLSLALIAETDDPLVAQGRLRDSEARGELATTCARIATRVADDDERFRRAEVVEVVRLTIELRSGERLEREVLARCAIG